MTKTTREKEAVLSVFAGLVQPLMRVAFEYGISAGEIAGAVRRVYIQALEARLRDQKRPTTDARLAVVSGLAKSDVSALREASRLGAPHSARSIVADQVGPLLTVWHTQPGFSGAYGLAMELDLQPTPGSPRRSFRDLTQAACPGVDEEALLDELVAVGCVEVIDGRTVRCLSRAYVSQSQDVKQFERMGRFLASVVASVVHNVLNIEPLYFERRVHSGEPLSEGGRDKFLALTGERAQELLAELDTFLTRLAGTERSESGKRYGVGIYFFEHEAGERAEADSKAPVEPKSRAPMQEIDVLAGLGNRK